MERDRSLRTRTHESDEQSVDIVLLQLIAAGDEAALDLLYELHSGLVYGLALHILRSISDAEEITQDVFLTLWVKAKTFDPAKGSVPAWLSAIARNRAIDRLRSKRHKEQSQELPLEAAQLDIPENNPVSNSSNSPTVDENVRTVRLALNRLSEPERKIIELAYFEGFTHSKLAVHLGWPLGTVKTRLRRAIIRVREMIAYDE